MASHRLALHGTGPAPARRARGSVAPPDAHAGRLQYTPGWGSLGTVTVAILAIIFSARYNRRTLALNAQNRADSRGDVLRQELAQWLTLVSEIEWLCGDLLNRIREINIPSNPSEVVDDAEILRRARRLRSVVGQELSTPLRNYDTQRTQIHMLTADPIIMGNMHLITQAIIGKRQILANPLNTIQTHANRTPADQQRQRQNYTMAVLFAPMLDHQYTRQITASRGDITNHIIARFNPAAFGTAAQVIRAYPDVLGGLQPTTVIIPPQQSQQPPQRPPQPPQPPPPGSPAGDGE